jgi:site-specific DNA-cytosine methylase
VRVLVACEFSGAVRDAFAAKGHDAWSCDLLPSETPGNHLQCDAREAFGKGSWDLIVAHPPCTHLAVSGAKHFHKKRKRQRRALEFFLACLNAPAPMVCVENPVSVVASHIRPADQTVQPWMFGHEATKTTCLWLKNLPPLRPTKIVGKGEFVIYRKKDGSTTRLPKWYAEVWNEKRGTWGRLRSRTFPGMAAAMAGQWDGSYRPRSLGFDIPVNFRGKK